MEQGKFATKPVDRIPDYDPRSGNHYWTLGIIYHVNPESPGFGKEVYLDRENLVYTMFSPACFYCEEIYTPHLAKRRCPGKATDGR